MRQQHRSGQSIMAENAAESLIRCAACPTAQSSALNILCYVKPTQHLSFTFLPVLAIRIVPLIDEDNFHLVSHRCDVLLMADVSSFATTGYPSTLSKNGAETGSWQNSTSYESSSTITKVLSRAKGVSVDFDTTSFYTVESWTTLPSYYEPQRPPDPTFLRDWNEVKNNERYAYRTKGGLHLGEMTLEAVMGVWVTSLSSRQPISLIFVKALIWWMVKD
jgi:hypothetical protein